MDKKEKITSMRAGGKKLARVKRQLLDFTKPGVRFSDIEAEAQRLIAQEGAKPSFSTVEDYQWATCIMKNDGLCHGIPTDQIVEDGDVVTIDVGLIDNGYHLDTSITFAVGDITAETRQFLEIGKRALNKAINRARPGKTVYDVSRAMQKVVERAGYGAVYQLTGHGIGKELHMDPAVPCVAVKSDKRHSLEEGMTLAIEIMYAEGDPTLKLDADGWTYRTKDGSLSGMFEETVLVTADKPEVLTR